ncbi:MAG TPA: phospholipase [Rudaea sp.]|nr:phospholipase [Rudaea sp.]
MANSLLVVFVHGWSVTNTDTYGELPARLKREAGKDGGPPLDVRNIYLGQYVSFRDEVRLEDISRAFDAATADLLAEAGGSRRFLCITHSTGGPVVRDWLDRFYVKPGKLADCPLSHLIMLAPANFGSALAQLGKSRLARLANWFDGVEPGQRVLEWLELGSPEAIDLNSRWIADYAALNLTTSANPLFLFVLTGDRIDRKLYDHLNSYTGELGSDGVVRAAAANLNATYVRLEQPQPDRGDTLARAKAKLRSLDVAMVKRSPRTAFKIIPGASHSGDRMGIMRSVTETGDLHPTAAAILRCLQVTDNAGYAGLCDAFDNENSAHQAPANRLEIEHVPVIPDREYVHDPHSMLIFRLLDDHGAHITEVDVLMTAGPKNSPDELPEDFLADRQANHRDPSAITFFLNFAALAGSPAVPRPDGSIARPELITRGNYGLVIRPRTVDGVVLYLEGAISAATNDLLEYVEQNQTTLVDIVLTRVVRSGVFTFTRQLAPRSFKNDAFGNPI